jgi:hypothetical protein
MGETAADPERMEIDRTIDTDEYEAVRFGPWQRWHAVANGALQTMCGRGNLNYAERMWHRWVLQKVDRCHRCERVAVREGLLWQHG